MSWRNPKNAVHCGSRQCAMWSTTGPRTPVKFLGGNNKNNCRNYLLAKNLSRSALQNHRNWR
jgi:hypothetical protein